MTSAHGSGTGGGDAVKQTLSIRAVVETLAGSTGLLVSLAFYFGWVRTSKQALYFGIDQSILGLSTQDYLLRSADALFVPLGTLLITGLVALAVHHALMRLLTSRVDRRVLLAGAAVLVVAGAALLFLGIAAALAGVRFDIYFLLPPLSPGLGVTFAGYGLFLANRLRPAEIEPVWLPSAGLILVVLVVVLSLFWTVSEYAAALGRGRALALAANLGALPSAVVYSERDLHVQAEGVEVEVLDGEAPGYRYRYSGLRLLIRSGGNFFLLPSSWSRSDGVVVVVPDDRSVRIEFSPGTQI